MRVVISVFGRFHAFDVARQLERRGMLQRLVTSMPTFVAARWDIPPARVRSLAAFEALLRVAKKAGVVERWPALGLPGRVADAYDRAVALGLEGGADVVEAWSQSALHTLRRAKRRGAAAFLKRGSAHIETQRDLLREEADRWGIPYHGPSQATIDRELAEYDAADRVVVGSEFIRQTFLARGFPAERLLHNTLGVDTGAYRRVAPRQREVFRVVFAGGVGYRKGVPYLVEAFSRAALPSNAELVLAGNVEPDFRPHLERLVAADPRVRVVGHLSRDALLALYASATAFCLPSVEDGFGVVLTQAMACGVPVLHSDHTGGADVVRHGVDGFGFPSRDVDALAAHLQRLHDTPDLSEAMCESAAERIADGFGWDAYGDRLVARYAHALAELRGHGQAGTARRR